MNAKYYLTKVFDCNRCGGMGVFINGTEPVVCPDCDGDGQIEVPIELELALKELGKKKKRSLLGDRLLISQNSTRADSNKISRVWCIIPRLIFQTL